MAVSLKQCRFIRPLFITSRYYCDTKSIYQRDEEGPKPRTVFGKPYPDWRKPWIERKGEFTSKLSVFVEKSPSTDILTAMQKLPNLNMQMVKEWWANMQELKTIENQMYIAQRVEVLGSNLAALHFFTFRNASVRLRNSNKWIVGIEAEMKLPEHFVDGYYVEAIDCTNFIKGGMRYEGLLNLMDLTSLKWLSLRGNKHIDVWGLDRIAGLVGKNLQYLDISGCNLCVGCVNALARMEALQFLTITDPGDNLDLQAGLSLLEQEKPTLLINAIKNNEEISI